MLYDAKKISELTGVTQPTVYSRLKLKEVKPYIVKKQGKVYVDEEGFKIIKDNLKINISSNIAEEETAASQEATTDTEPFKNLKEDLIEVLKSEVEFLRIELAEKNRQLENKDKQLESKDRLLESNDKLMENMQVLLKNEQEQRGSQQNILMLEEHFKELDERLLDLKEQLVERKQQNSNSSSWFGKWFKNNKTTEADSSS